MARKQRRSAEEREFLAQYDASQFPHPSVTVDIVLMTVAQDKLRALVIERDQHPDRGRWSLPGGFVGPQESLEDCASRVLADKAGLKRLYLEQLYTFGAPERDPRTRVISVAYFALIPSQKLDLHPGPDRRWAEVQVSWKGESGGKAQVLDDGGHKTSLAFDHADILGLAVQRLRGKLNYAPIGFELLPREFTLRQLQTIHETILDRSLNKDSFRRRILASGLVTATGKREAQVGHRPAELYRFSRKPAR